MCMAIIALPSFVSSNTWRYAIVLDFFTVNQTAIAKKESTQWHVGPESDVCSEGLPPRYDRTASLFQVTALVVLDTEGIWNHAQWCRATVFADYTCVYKRAAADRPIGEFYKRPQRTLHGKRFRATSFRSLQGSPPHRSAEVKSAVAAVALCVCAACNRPSFNVSSTRAP